MDVSGTVIEVGPGLKDSSSGDRVLIKISVCMERVAMRHGCGVAKGAMTCS